MIREDAWADFLAMIAKYEGEKVPFMYLDTKGLVTTATGKLIDPVVLAAGIPFAWPDGKRATWPEIVAEWNYVKSRTDLAPHGGMAFGAVTKLRLSSKAMDVIVEETADAMWAHLLKRLPDLELWPKDPTVAILGMAWAAGPGFVAPKFIRAANMRDWATCAAECALHTPRDPVHKALFLEAAAAQNAVTQPDIMADNKPAFLLPDPDLLDLGSESLDDGDENG